VDVDDFVCLVTSQQHSHTHHPHSDHHEGDQSITRIQRIAWFLDAHFGDVELHMPEEGGEQDQEQDQSEKSQPALIVRMDDSGESDAYINLVTLVCTDVDVFMPCSINPP
jgi:cleavage and polyadenylation specificity factor subunit 3